MRPFGEKSGTNWPSRTRSGRILQLSGDTKEKNCADMKPQHANRSVDSVISMDETFEGATQVLDDFTDGFSSELVDAVCDTQVLDDIEDTCQTQRRSLEDEQQGSNEHKDNNGNGLEDMEGDTQILDDPEDVSPDHLVNFETRAEVNENETLDENICTQILDDHGEQLCSEGPVTATDGQTAVSSNELGSSKEDLCKISSDCLTVGTTKHTSDTSVAHTTNNCGVAAGYKPPRFTEIRVEAWIAYGLAVKKRALSGNTADAICSAKISPGNLKHIDEENHNSVKGSPSSMERTDVEDCTAFHEPGDSDIGKGRKVKSSAVRKLFAEESVPLTEACDIISTSTGDDESELHTGKGDFNAAGLSYLDSQEPNDLAHAKALDFVEKFLTDNMADIDKNDLGGSRVKNTADTPIAHSNSKQCLVKKRILKSTDGLSKAFDWDDDNEDEGGGAFFRKLKEKSFKTESHFQKSAPPIRISKAFDCEQREKRSEESKANPKKRKLSYSDTRIVSRNLKKTIKSLEGNAKQNILNLRNWEPSTRNNATDQITPDMPFAGEDASTSTSAVMELNAGHDTHQLITTEDGNRKVISVGRTRRGSYIKTLYFGKRVRSCSDKVSEKLMQSMHIPIGQEEETSEDAPLQNQDAKKRTMENPACAERKTRSNGEVATLVTSNDVCQFRETKRIKSTQSKAKASRRTVCNQARQPLINKDAIPRRSCRLNKVTKLEDSGIRQVNQGSNGSAIVEDLSLQNVNKHGSAGATKEQQSHTDFRTTVKDDTLLLETSPTRRTCLPGTECLTPTSSAKPSEEASPICMGDEYYKISCSEKFQRSDLKKENNNMVTVPPKAMSGLKDLTKRRVMTDVRVLFSRHLDEDTVKHQKKIVDRLGASIASSISDATHFIADKFARTKNMLEAIALGKPVVTPSWLVSCNRTKFHKDEQSYILQDKMKEKEFGFSMVVSLDLARRQPLLQKRRVFITPNTKPGKEVIGCLVKAVGGRVIGRIPRSALRDDKSGDDLIILTCEEDFAVCEPFLEKGAKVYSSELLLNGIVTQRLEFERYRLFNNCTRKTRSVQLLDKDSKKFLRANSKTK